MRAIRGHSGGNKVDLSLQANVEIPYQWIAYIYHAGSSHDCNSVQRSSLVAGLEDAKEGRQAVFFTSVDPMNEPQEKKVHDVTKPRQVLYRTRWKVYENAACRNNLNIAQGEGLAFWQTPANAVVLCDAVPADCLGKVVHTKTEEILHQKIHCSPRLSRTNYPQTCLQDRHEGHAQRGARAGERRVDNRTLFWISEFQVYYVPKLNKRKKRVGNSLQDSCMRPASPKQICINCWFTKQTSVYSVQRRIKTNDSHSWKLGMPRIMRNTTPKSMLLLEVLGRVNRLL